MRLACMPLQRDAFSFLGEFLRLVKNNLWRPAKELDDARRTDLFVR
jgi:hypothetical protein